MKFLPDSISLKGVFSNQHFAQPASDIVTERCVDDGLDNLGGGIGLADTLKACVRAHTDKDGVLAAGGFVFQGFKPQNLAYNLYDLHFI